MFPNYLVNTSKCEWRNSNNTQNSEHENKKKMEHTSEMKTTKLTDERTSTKLHTHTWVCVGDAFSEIVNECDRGRETERNWMLKYEHKIDINNYTRRDWYTQIIHTHSIYICIIQYNIRAYHNMYWPINGLVCYSHCAQPSPCWCSFAHDAFVSICLHIHTHNTHTKSFRSFLWTFVNNFLTFDRVQTSRLSRCHCRRSIDLSQSILFFFIMFVCLRARRVHHSMAAYSKCFFSVNQS